MPLRTSAGSQHADLHVIFSLAGATEDWKLYFLNVSSHRK